MHFTLENPGDMWAFELHHENEPHGTAIWGRLRESADRDTFSLKPGEWTVACLPASDTSYYEADAATAVVTVVDPDGLYVPWDLACGFGEQFRTTIAVAEGEEPEEVFRRVPGVRPTDEFRTPNYPESPQYGPTVIVFREGVAVARIMSFGTNLEELLVNACPGSGVRKT